MENVQNLRSGKMLEEHSPQTTEKTSDVSWKNLHTSSKQTLQFLNLLEKAENGLNQAQFPVMDGLWHGDSSMLNIGECPNVVKESRLSWILEDNVPQKYYLSARACQGILTRASRRGKALPELLKNALLEMIEWWEKKSFCIVGNMIDRETNMNGTGVKEDTAFTINTIDRNAVAYTLKIHSECEGGGKGALVQTEKSATLSTLQDQTLICLADNTSLHNLKQKICVLNDQGGSVMNVSYDIVGTIRAQEHGHQPIVFESHSQDARYTQQGNTSPACTAQWGTGGNNMPLVAEKKAFAMQRIGEYKESEQASTMKSRDYKDATDLVIEKNEVNCAGFQLGFRPENTRYYDECATTLCNGTRPGWTTGCILNWIVRRLTPVECERLQGFPDGWTDIGEWVDENGKKHKPADSPRYKALGNSIALPQWYWIFQKMKPYIGENPTLGSLFDGIGGFPLVFESTYGDGTAIWGSEIEPFCVAVTKKHFPED